MHPIDLLISAYYDTKLSQSPYLLVITWNMSDEYMISLAEFQNNNILMVIQIYVGSSDP